MPARKEEANDRCLAHLAIGPHPRVNVPLLRAEVWGQNPGRNLTAIDVEALSAHGYEAIGLVGKLIGAGLLVRDRDFRIAALSDSPRVLA